MCDEAPVQARGQTIVDWPPMRGQATFERCIHRCRRVHAVEGVTHGAIDDVGRDAGGLDRPPDAARAEATHVDGCPSDGGGRAAVVQGALGPEPGEGAIDVFSGMCPASQARA